MSKEDNIGVNVPIRRPSLEPNSSPARKTGMCMGRKTFPRPNMWKNMGSTIPRAKKRAQPVIL